MKKLVPDMYYKSIYDINYSKLKSNKVKYLFFDVDNTVLPYTENEPNKKAQELFNKLKKDGFKCFLFSNSSSKRIDNIKEILKIDAYTSSMKPLSKNYKKVLKKYKKEECIFIGDQLMTDVLGAKKNNFNIILVDSIDKIVPITTKFWMCIEFFVLKKLKKQKLFEKGKYYE